MALTDITFSPTSIDRAVPRNGPHGWRFVTVTATGNEAFTDADLSKVGSASWLVIPATCDDGVAFVIEFDPRLLVGGKYTETLRATKGAVTADLAITLNVQPGP